MILILDGDSQVAQGLERMFKYRGFDALAVGDAMEGLALLEMRKPGIIILELNLKGMEGMRMLEAIRTDQKYADVPVIIYTLRFADELRRAALALGAQDFIVKGTIGWEALVERVGKHYKRSEKPPL